MLARVTLTIGATSGGDGVTQRHAIRAGTTSGRYCDFLSHATGADITSGEDRVTQSHTTGIGSASGTHRDIQGHAISGGGHATQSYAIGARARNQRNQNNRCQSTEKRIRLRVLPVKVRDSLSGRMLERYALLDNGSDVSLCDSELVKELGPQGERRDFFLTTKEKNDSAKSRLELKLTVSSLDGASTSEIPRVWSVDCLNISSRSIPVPEDVKGWPHLSDIELPEIQGKDVRLLIVCNSPEAFRVLEERRGARGQPVAVRSLLGWTLMGPVERLGGDSNFNVNFVHLESGRGDHDEALLQQLKKFWRTDFVDALCSSKVAMSVEDQKALKTMEDSVKIVSCHYQVALPWRNQLPYLPNNRLAAEQRLQFLKKRFLRNEEFFQRYKGTINEYITEGYAHWVPHEELHPTGKPVWYLSHHAVFHPHKPDKLRVVFDCAAKFQGMSLNDQLLHGPDFTNNLSGVLNRFHQESIALVSDIKAMFHQVRVDPRDFCGGPMTM